MYDNLYDPMYDLDIKEVLAQLPREVVDARNQRVKRAMNLFRARTCSSQLLRVLVVLQVKKENAEHEALGALPLYQRKIP
ncbi:hypothetical protein C4D60_Mb06t29270 [Musa balbisiana]|uniref:Uncharacterized protein n=1 Tax=Musa balbisiana TaxID=52838 RepID=A0A4S8IRN3_MUSBA|nr:hypothetical protein C4D60_Mb06t29270 [Musa balbisiana]